MWQMCADSTNPKLPCHHCMASITLTFNWSGLGDQIVTLHLQAHGAPFPKSLSSHPRRVVMQGKDLQLQERPSRSSTSLLIHYCLLTGDL
jgi:hypothetical protein